MIKTEIKIGNKIKVVLVIPLSSTPGNLRLGKIMNPDSAHEAGGRVPGGVRFGRGNAFARTDRAPPGGQRNRWPLQRSQPCRRLRRNKTDERRLAKMSGSNKKSMGYFVPAGYSFLNGSWPSGKYRRARDQPTLIPRLEKSPPQPGHGSMF